MASKVLVHSGTYRGTPVINQQFELVFPMRTGARGQYITVRPAHGLGLDRSKIRIFCEEKGISRDVDATISVETDEETIQRISERFEILEEMTKATLSSDIRAMIVVGPPGVGKSYGVEKQLERANTFDVIKDLPPKYVIVKGAMTAIGLYNMLYKYSDKGNVIVFDDCDTVLLDDLSLNILKAALDSGKKRTIFWNSDSSYLRREGIPDKFDFKGSAIFITNLKFEHLKSKKLKDHLDALQSRCHYLDLTLDTMREKYLRVKQISMTGELFGDYRFENNEAMDIIEFMGEYKEQLREMSLRMALKIADLVKISPLRWKALARTTCMQ